MGTEMTQTPSYSKAKIRLILTAIILNSVIYGFGMFKLIPMEGAIEEYFNIGAGAYSYLTTAGNWVIILLSVQMGFLTRKLPCKMSISLGFAVGAVGMILQIFTANFIVFVAGRAIEGAGLAVATLATTSLLMNMVPREKVGFWSGISILCAVGPQVLITKGGATLMSTSGMSFQTIFIIITILYVIAIASCFLFIPSELKISGVASSEKPTKEQTKRVFKNKSNWLVNISYVFFGVVSINFSMYVVKFLVVDKGFDFGEAANIYSYTTIIGMIAMLVFGWVSDKLGTKRKIVIIGYIAGAIALVLLAILPGNLIMIYVILYGTLPRSIAGLTTASSADIAENPSDIPIVNSLRNEVMQIGSVIFTAVMGYSVEFLGYATTIYMLAGGMIIGAICWVFAKKIP